MAIIYKIQNKLTGRVYIGHTTTTLEKRIYFHRDRLRRSAHPAMQDDYDVHGWDAFKVSAIETVADSEARQREQHWIEHHGVTMRLELYNVWSAVSSDHKKPADGYKDRMKNRLRRARGQSNSSSPGV